jgi:hypothetical protein
MCSSSETVIVNEDFKPVAWGITMAQHKIGKHRGFNVYVRRIPYLDKYFIQMPQKAFHKSDIEKLPGSSEDEKLGIDKKELEKIKNKLKVQQK